MPPLHPDHKLNAMQIQNIIDKLVPIIAAPEDVEFFRGVLFIKAENSSSSDFAYFVNKLLKESGVWTG
ncbi:MAG: hypothetical protein KKF30_07530 [Proteobacteria bacterium]|nr:hypothetical protein [Pseudomonadota bacterium]MBU4470281.1 hypothetical protein [Pseudomonadota bacterium]MCG2752694.1 hypothetical protein [Desulfobacteraceae bacterium]